MRYEYIFALLFFLLAPLPGSTAETTQRTANSGQLILQDVPEIPPALAARLHQYQNTRSAKFLDWTEDGKGMYIRTRFDDINQIHFVSEPGGARRQLTWFEDPTGQVERRSDGSELAFTMDRSEIGRAHV